MLCLPFIDPVTVMSARQTTDSGFVVVGTIRNFAFLAKLNKLGNLSWCKKYPESSLATNMGYDVLIEQTGYLILTESTTNNSLIKTDLSGNVSWAKDNSQYGGLSYSTSLERSSSLKKISGNRRMIVEKGIDGGGSVTVIDTTGNYLWGCATHYTGMDMSQLKNGWFVITVNPGPLVFKTSSSSSVSGPLGVIGMDSLRSNFNTCDHFVTTNSLTNLALNVNTVALNVVPGGMIAPVSPTLTNLVCLQYDGCLYWSIGGGIGEKNADAVMSLFPNPTEGKITVQSYLLSNSSSIELYDVSGRLVRKERLNSLSGKAEINLGDLNAGAYFYTVYFDAISFNKGKLLISK
jgi:hypothetical protein